MGFTIWAKTNCKKLLVIFQFRIPTLVEPSNQREHLDLFFLPVTSAWNEGHASKVTDIQTLFVVDAWTENEILLNVEGIASPSESVSFLLPVFASPRCEIKVCCILMTAVEIWEEWRWLSFMICLTIVLVRFTFLPSEQEQSPVVSCLTRMWFGHTCFKFLGLF